MPRKVEISGLSKWFGELEALRQIDVAVEQGEFIAVVGPSGCGKTTFLRMVAGLEPATSGTILIDGRPLRGPGNNRGFVFQNDSLPFVRDVDVIVCHECRDAKLLDNLANLACDVAIFGLITKKCAHR